MNINYNGIVTIHIKNKNKLRNIYTLHNTGTLDLFEAICKCLSGNYNYNDMPMYLDIVNSDNYESYLYSKIILTARNYGVSSGKNYAEFTATITLKDFNTISLPTDFTLKIFNNNQKSLAYLSETNSTIFDDLDRNSEVIIVWKMYVDNQTTSSQSNESQGE